MPPAPINFNARLYDPTIGRFLSADDRVPDPMDGQSYNLYSYVNNNPLNATDPSGHDSSNCGGSSGLGQSGCLPGPNIEEIIVTGSRYVGADLSGLLPLIPVNLLGGGFAIPTVNFTMPPIPAKLPTKPIATLPTKINPKDLAGEATPARPPVAPSPKPVAKDPKGDTNGGTLQCVANNSNSGGIVGGVLGGAAAASAGAPILPYSWFGGAVSGGGPSGGTSIISAAARGFIGPGLDFSSSGEFVNSESGATWNALSDLTGTASKAAIVGRVVSRASIVVGVGLEGYGAYKAYRAYQQCKASGG